jgi:CO/xanthine dehydrogenase FAD-binding subunit
MESIGRNYNQVFLPRNLSELFEDWASCPDAIIISGASTLGLSGTEDASVDLKPPIELPLKGNIISLELLNEVRGITRTERYIEIGAATPLNDIANMGKILPDVLFRAIKGTCNMALRNLFSVGGSIYSLQSSLIAAFSALESRYELITPGRGGIQNRWVSASRFSLEKQENLEQTLLGHIRIPLENWTFGAFSAVPDSDGEESVVLAASTEKSNLNTARAIYAGPSVPGFILQNREAEALLSGCKLPLDKKSIDAFAASWSKLLQTIPEMSDFRRASLLYFLTNAAGKIS